MTITYQASSSTTGFTLAAAGDTLIVMPDVFLANSSGGRVISSNFYATVSVYGSVIGGLTTSGGAINLGGVGAPSAVYVSSSGHVSNNSIYAAIFITIGSYHIVNDGEIASNFSGNTLGLVLWGDGGEVINNGRITAAGGSFSTAIDCLGATSSVHQIRNYGTISTNGNAVDVVFGSLKLFNAGTIIGDIWVETSAAASIIDSSQGQVFGTITCGSGGDIVVAGTNGGTVIGGTGNDNLQANRSQKSADDHTSFTLDGRLGNNALYGGGAFNTFVMGTWGEHTQVWGGKSLMGDVTGYLNNTAQFSNATQGVYVDVLNGHNAFINDSAGAWDGSGVFADWIVNVPNVVGSAYGDIIQADGTGGKITGAGGADALYGATGADTFAFTAYSDSNTVTGYDTVVNFQRGTDKIDISGFMAVNGLGAASLVLSGSGNSTTVYVERVAGTFNSATDLAFVVNSTAGVLTAADFIL